jgi:hypothetical protein
MNRALRAALVAGAAAAVGCFVWSSWPPNARYAPVEISFALVGLSFMVAGVAAWQRWPTSRLGVLFSIVGYLYLVPYILVNLANPVAWTIGNLSEGISGAALARVAWPGRPDRLQRQLPGQRAAHRHWFPVGLEYARHDRFARRARHNRHRPGSGRPALEVRAAGPGGP